MDPAEKTQDKTAAVVKRYCKTILMMAYTSTTIFILPRYNGGDDFPDDASWASYPEQRGSLSRERLAAGSNHPR
jgi:hypothetical protein